MRAHSSIPFIVLGLALAATPAPDASACTSLLVTPGASVDGSTMITYSADSHELYGELYYYPAARHPAGAKRMIQDWDTGKQLGEIDEVAQTFRVVGNMNEHQLAIAETTFGGREELVNPKGGIDYGSMIYVTLQRARTAREAVKTMASLAESYGYASEGESFSIADPAEAWIMDLIGKGPDRKGAVWVAVRVPDGYVSAHANQSRIRTFPLKDPDNCVYAPDLIPFAREKGWFQGNDEEFSFADTFNPPKCEDLRICEARVWSFFNAVAPSQKLSSDYVACRPSAAPLPMWVKPDKKLAVRDLVRQLRDHFEGTEFDMRNDIGAGPFALPYRWRPLTWEFEGGKYLHERAIATQQTGFSFVSQSRASLPSPIGGLLWFSVDDAASTVYVPMYSGIRSAPKPYAVGTGTFTRFSWDSAFWLFNAVANQAYGRYADMIKDIAKVQGEFEEGFFTEQPRIEQKAAALHKTSPTGAEELLTKYSAESSDRVMQRWRLLHQELLVKYLDGNVRDDAGKITHPRYPDAWYRKIVQERGDHLRLPAAPASGSGSAAPSPVAPAVSSAPASPAVSSAPPSSGCTMTSGGAPSLGWLAAALPLAIALIRRNRRRPSERIRAAR